MRDWLKVIKSDNSSVEEYLHKKVKDTISKALDKIGQADIYVAEQLAEVVTYFLYHRQNRRIVTSSEIFSIIKAVLSATDYEEAAVALNESHFKGKIKPSRIEVVSFDIQEFSDDEMPSKDEELVSRSQWDKFRIVENLVAKHDVDRQTALTIASIVEQQIFSMGITLVPSSLIKSLVMSNADDLLQKKSCGLIKIEPITVLIETGDATAEDLSEFFLELSTLYKMIGGSGIDFRITETKEPSTVYVS